MYINSIVLAISKYKQYFSIIKMLSLKFQIICFMLVSVNSYIFKIDPTSNGTFEIINSNIEQKVFDSNFFDVLFFKKSLTNQYILSRFSFQNNSIQIFNTGIYSNYSLVTVSKYPKSCVMFFDQAQNRAVYYIMDKAALNAGQPSAHKDDFEGMNQRDSAQFLSFKTQKIQINFNCLTSKIQNDIYLRPYYYWSQYDLFSLPPQTAQTNYQSTNYYLRMDKYGFYTLQNRSQGFHQIFAMDLFNKNQMQCIQDRCLAISYEPVYPIPFKLIIFQRYISNSSSTYTYTWKIKLQYNDQSLITPVLNVNSNFKNILLTYQKQNKFLSVLNIQYIASTDSDKIVYLTEQKNGIDRQVTLSDNHLLYIDKKLDQNGFIGFTVYQRDNFTKVIDYLVDSVNMQNYKFSTIQQKANNKFYRLLNVFQNDSIFYWCQDYHYKLCANIIEDTNDTIIDVLSKDSNNSLTQSNISTTSVITSTILIVIISISIFIVLVLIIIIVLAKTYIIECPDCCWTTGCFVAMLTCLGIEQNYDGQNLDQTDQTLESYLDKLQMENNNKLQSSQNIDTSQFIKQMLEGVDSKDIQSSPQKKQNSIF